MSLWLERPEHGDQEGGYQPKDDGEGEAGTEEVAEFVASGTVNEGIGLVADRGREAGGGAEHDGDDKGDGVNAKGLGNDDGEGREQDSDGVVGYDFCQHGCKQVNEREHDPWVFNAKALGHAASDELGETRFINGHA